MPQFIVQFKNNNDPIKIKHIKVHRLMNQAEKQNLNFDVELPKKEYDSIEFYLRNFDGTTTYMDNIRVSSFN